MGELSKSQKRNWNKIYPKVTSDDSGPKFHFNCDSKHFTIRFSWNPLLMLQHLTKIVGSEEDAIHILSVMGEAFYSIADAWKSPFVIYVNNFDSNIK